MATTISIIILFLIQIHVSSSEDDVKCLRGFHDAISDPGDHLQWDFSSNASSGLICIFNGVTCRNYQENRVLAISLASSSLSGEIPSDLKFCVSLTYLDLSNNSISGPFPPSLCSWLPYLVTLDLSNNQLSGEIPPSISDCQFLNSLSLSYNKLSGPIPPSISQLNRLVELDLSFNSLSGQIPSGLSSKLQLSGQITNGFSASAFNHNTLEYEPRSTDFGLARLVRSVLSEDPSNTTPFLNEDFGEFGYVAPEYATNPAATTKGDIFAFGVILLELATGQRAVEVSSYVAGDGFKGDLMDWINQLSLSGRLDEAIDKSLVGKGNDGKIVEFLKIACRCVVPRPKERPTMYRVYHDLKSIGGTNDPSEQFDEFPLPYGIEEG